MVLQTSAVVAWEQIFSRFQLLIEKKIKWNELWSFNQRTSDQWFSRCFYLLFTCADLFMSGGLTVGRQLHRRTLIPSAINQPAPEETPTVSEIWGFIFLSQRSFIHSFGKMVHSGQNKLDLLGFFRFFIVEILFNQKSKFYHLFIAC